MTRQEIEDQYTVENGIIQDPGKFEGEPLWSPYFYDLYLNGCADYDGDDELWFDIDDEDLAQFPELVGYTRVILREDEQGFVYCEADGEPV